MPLLVFSALLGQSNARFGDLISDLFRRHLPAWNSGELAFAVIQLVFWAFLLGAPVCAALLATRPAPQVKTAHEPRLTLTKLGISLLSVSALFYAYLLVQLNTLFHPGLSAGQTYSESVQRGFGELTAVAALTLQDMTFGPALTCALARQNDASSADTGDWRICNLARNRAAGLIPN